MLNETIIPIAAYSCQIIIYTILYYIAYRRSIVFSTNVPTGNELLEQRILEAVIPSKLKPSNLAKTISEEQLEQYKLKLNEAMDNHVFIQPNLILKELATNLNIPINHLSYLINNIYQVNFNEFINQHRIEFAKSMMKEDIQQKKTIYAIAKECGFNSEKPFNLAFKQFMGITPKQFRIQLAGLDETSLETSLTKEQ